MALDLEMLRTDMQSYLQDSEIAVFYGYDQVAEALGRVYWDTEAHPNFREFISCASRAGAKLIVFHHQSFSLGEIDDALEQLDASSLPREDKRTFESRLKQLQAYEGFTCSVELSFSVDGRVYAFALQTEWYATLSDIQAELESAAEEEDEDGSDETLGGYFSKN